MTIAAEHPSRSVWLIALGLSLGPAVSNGLARFAYGLLLPAMRQDLSWSYTEAGWINTANSIGYLIGALLGLRYVSVIGPRHLFLGGMVLTTLALLASGLTRDFWPFSIWRVVAGIGGAPAFIAGGAMASTLFKGDNSRNSMAIALYFGGGGLGMLLSGLSLPIIIEWAGVDAWPLCWLILAGLSGIATVPAALAAAAAPGSRQSNGGGRRQPLPAGRMAPALIGYALFSVSYIVYLTFIVAWMRDHGAGAPLVAATWGLMGAAVMISPFVWRPVLTSARGGKALALSCTATGVGTLMPLFVPGTIGVLLSAAAFGGAFFIVPASVTAFSRKNLPDASWGPAVAVFTSVFAVGQIFGPVAAGFIADLSSSLTLGLTAAGATLLLAAAIGGTQRPLDPAAGQANAR